MAATSVHQSWLRSKTFCSITLVVIVLLSFSNVALVSSTRYFPNDAVWFEDISTLPVSPFSQVIMDSLYSAPQRLGCGSKNINGNWGGCPDNHGYLEVGFAFHVNLANSNTHRYPIVAESGYYYDDCPLTNLTTMPVPTGGAVEGYMDYTCEGGDCHLIVADTSAGILYEVYTAYFNGTHVQTSTCALKWQMCGEYNPNIGLRGEKCSSTDAAGLPVAQLLFTPDEIADGVIDHPIRLILPSTFIRNRVYTHPASHSTTTSGIATSVPYGSRLRLKSSFNAANYSIAAKVVITALKTYGLIMADAGNIALTAVSDQFFTNKWDTVGFYADSLRGILTSDFEVVAQDNSTLVYWDGNCVINPLPPTGACPSIVTGGNGAPTSLPGTATSLLSWINVLINNYC